MGDCVWVQSSAYKYSSRVDMIQVNYRDMIAVHAFLRYSTCMSRTSVDIDDKACAEVMRRYHLATKREAINFALRTLAAEPTAIEPMSVEEARSLRGIGWEGNLDEMRSSRVL